MKIKIKSISYKGYDKSTQEAFFELATNRPCTVYKYDHSWRVTWVINKVHHLVIFDNLSTI